MPSIFTSGSAYTLPPFTLTSLIDILAVAFLIYQLLLIVRGTRAAHILIGISTVILVYGISVWAGLDALRSMLSYIVPYTAIAVIILFQSEFRRTLARIGRKRWLGGGFQRPEALDEILLAMNTLAQEKTGAIIVLERDIGLRTFVESGVRLDAQISRDLLLAVFRPGGALHDGAVIIQKDRISAAACFLPLSTNPAIAGNFGTRHRAGIGITEETDCLSLLVSEETGYMSIAAFGELYSNLTLKQVDERVNRHFGVGKYKSGREEAAPKRVEPEKAVGA
ncbi:MAG: diadenylate cyclase CdaA [Bryobacteraceae bacterium]